LANGCRSLTAGGFTGKPVKESKDRVRRALQNANLTFPASKRITIKPRACRSAKEGRRFDSGNALAWLAASGQIPAGQS